jgi:hypothetical protein
MSHLGLGTAFGWNLPWGGYFRNQSRLVGGSKGKDAEKRHLRPTDRDWIKTFQNVKREKLVKCPGCGRISFGSANPGKKCLKCDGILPGIKSAEDI